MNRPIKKIITIILCIAVLISIILIIQSHFEIQEGFQISESGCVTKTIGGVVTNLCDSEEDAYVKLSNNLAASIKSPVCYTDRNSLKFTDISANAYICYDINGDPQFDSVLGKYSEYDPLSDEDPLLIYRQRGAIMNNIAFKAGFNSFSIGHENTLKLANAVSTIGFGDINYVKTQLNTLSDTYCRSGHNNKYDDTCSTIATALARTNAILTDNSSTSLKYISTTIGQSLSTIKHATYNEFVPGFYDSFVITPEISTIIAKYK